jgi:hypothetical protein
MYLLDNISVTFKDKNMSNNHSESLYQPVDLLPLPSINASLDETAWDH